MGRFLSSNPPPLAVDPVAPAVPVYQPHGAAAPAATPVSKVFFSAASSYEHNPLRKFAFYCGLGMLLVRLGVLSEIIYSLTGINTYLLYLVAPPAILGALMTGAVARTFQQRAAYYWMAFFAWMILATPFSEWRGASAHLIFDYARAELMLLFVLGGLAVNWKEIRLIIYTIAFSGLLNLIMARLFMRVDNGRISVNQATGTIGNSNDLASQLLLVLPFLLFIAMDSKRSVFFRIASLAPLAYGIWLIVGTASRGAAVGLLVMTLLFLWRSSMRQRIVLVAFGILMAVVVSVALQRSTLDRLEALFGKEHQEADESASSRSYLFRQSVIFTLQHPIFGVGPGQFSNSEGKESLKAGRVGNWHATHCTWTQVSSECGIPAMIFYICGVASALWLVNRTYKAARARRNTEIMNACFCYMLAMVGFLVSITFLANAYRLYFPVMIGIAISMSFVANNQMNAGHAVGRRR